MGSAERIRNWAPVPPSPVIVHKNETGQPVLPARYEDAVLCIDSREFSEEELRTAISGIRERSLLVPIVVVGDGPRQERSDRLKDISTVTSAGAIYFDRPQDDTEFREVVSNISHDLGTAYQEIAPLDAVYTELSDGTSLGEDQKKDLEFYGEAPFRISDSSLETLLDRINTEDADSKYND